MLFVNVLNVLFEMNDASVSNVIDDESTSATRHDRRYSAIEKTFYLDRLVNGGLSLKELAKETGIGRNRLRTWTAESKAGSLVDDPMPIADEAEEDGVDVDDEDERISTRIQLKSVDDIIYAPRAVFYSDLDGALFSWYQNEVRSFYQIVRRNHLDFTFLSD